MILNSSFEDLITSQHADFKDKTRKIYEYKITKSVNAKAKQNAGDTFNIYISGIDTYGPVSSVSRSDVNIIMTINNDEVLVKLLWEMNLSVCIVS